MSRLNYITFFHRTPGSLVADYSYDAWGNVVSVKDENGNAITDQTHIANVNPIRYRGYYYDSETNLYYLNSRYYDSEVKRFINSDVITDGGNKLLGNNLFIYCGNNSVNNSDSKGNWFVKDAIKWLAKDVFRPVAKKLKSLKNSCEAQRKLME